VATPGAADWVFFEDEQEKRDKAAATTKKYFIMRYRLSNWKAKIKGEKDTGRW
jgi:hypothetical protein